MSKANHLPVNIIYINNKIKQNDKNDDGTIDSPNQLICASFQTLCKYQSAHQFCETEREIEKKLLVYFIFCHRIPTWDEWMWALKRMKKKKNNGNNENGGGNN